MHGVAKREEMTPKNGRRPLATIVIPFAVIMGGGGLTILGAFVIDKLTGGTGNPGVCAGS